MASSSVSNVLPSDDEIRHKIYSLLRTIDIETMGVKSFIVLLSNEMNVLHDILKTKKDYIKEILTTAINEGNHKKDDDYDDDDNNNDEEDDNDVHDENDDEDNDEEDDDEIVNQKSNSGRGLAQKKEISSSLSSFLGKGTHMARTEVVKELWNYIREHNLQNPNNKREILLDSAMQKVFNCTTFTMFTMNKYISAHIEPYTPVDLTPKKLVHERGGKRLRGSGGSSSKNNGKSLSSSKKKPRKVGTQPPYRLSDELQAVVGTDILPRPQVVSKIWTYIKEHDLQNPNDKREILCDTKLKAVLGNKDKISMFQMNVHIGHHLLEKLDKSEYQHDNHEENDEDEDDEE